MGASASALCIAPEDQKLGYPAPRCFLGGDLNPISRVEPRERTSRFVPQAISRAPFPLEGTPEPFKNAPQPISLNS